MKKIVLLLCIAACSFSCKQTETTEEKTPVVDSTDANSATADREDDCDLLVYDGTGTFSRNSGDVTYTLSLPSNEVNTCKFKYFRVAKDVVFIHLDNDKDVALSNANCEKHELKFAVPEYKSSDNITQFEILLCHDNIEVDKDKAIEIYKEYITKDQTPKKFGNGVLSITN
jgi:hypothetical protein